MPYYVGALAAWFILMICLGLFYFQQIQVATDTAQKLGDVAQTLQGQAPKINKLAQEQGSLLATLNSVTVLGSQHDIWAQILDALNDKMPQGVWITNFTPIETPKANAPGGRPNIQSQNQGPVNQVDSVSIEGLYHANERTQLIDPSRLRDFVNALADLPLFDIDKNNITSTLVSFTTRETAPNAFAQRFTMHLKLKSPILLKPEEGK
jgi:Tfp pilus assembly protein PilN